MSSRANQSPMRAFQPGSRRMSACSLTCALTGVEAAGLRQLGQAQLEQGLGDQQTLLDRFQHQVVGALAQQRGLVVAVVVAGHHQHRQAPLAVTEDATHLAEQVMAAERAFQIDIGQQQVATDIAIAAADVFVQVLQRIFGADHVQHLHRLAFQHALGRSRHHPAVLDIQHARALDRRRLHIAADEGRKCAMAEALVEIIGHVFGEGTGLQRFLRIAGHHDNRHVGLPGGFAHHARHRHAVAVGQQQGGGDQIDRTSRPAPRAPRPGWRSRSPRHRARRAAGCRRSACAPSASRPPP